MHSIYSLEALQRIVDYWGIGQICFISRTHFEGRSIWRHLIATNQGEFDIFSYPADQDPYYESKLANYFEYNRGQIYEEKVHRFDRYHVLLRTSIQQRISVKQLMSDMEILKKQSVPDAYRVYGTILQIELPGNGVLWTYAKWKLERSLKGENTSVDSTENSKEELDVAIEEFKSMHPAISSFVLKDDTSQFAFSDGSILTLKPEGKFEAVTIHIAGRKNWIKVFTENEIYYTKDI